jgi:hypothetical protein
MDKGEKKELYDKYQSEINTFWETKVRKRIGGKPEHAFQEWALKKIVELEAKTIELQEELDKKANKRG